MYHGLRMWCDDLRCLYSFLKIEVDLCFQFDLREVLDIRDFLKETTSALKLRFDCRLLEHVSTQEDMDLEYLLNGVNANEDHSEIHQRPASILFFESFRINLSNGF